MTPADFIARWRDNSLGERQGAQQHFSDLCDLLGVDKPTEPDHYCFERGALRTGSGRGWADVWKRGCFAWEYKAPGGDMGKALKQLMTYALALDNPPLLVVSDRRIIQIHTHFTGRPSEIHTIAIDDIAAPENLQKLRWLFNAPERFKPDRTVADVTAEAAGYFADIARSMTARGHDPHKVAHFLIQCLFCMFSEDVELLPSHLFERLLAKRKGAGLAELFKSMQKGGEFGLDDIPWFNGGLFQTIEVIALEAKELQALHTASTKNWSQIEPAIFGTLFERGLNPAMRSQLGAHYTDPVTIMKIVGPVVMEPLEREWKVVRDQIEKLSPKFKLGKITKSKTARSAAPNKEMAEAYGLFRGYLERLKDYRVLDPACGSGNFLYLALKSLKDLEHRVNLEAETLGLQREVNIETSPANVLGIELNDYAAELARVTIWIGEIQWMLKYGYDVRRNPILQGLDHVEQRDAVLYMSESPPDTGQIIGEPEWPVVDAIIGNPPFLGDKKMRGELGDEYTVMLRSEYAGRVPGGADLVTYWFEKARAHIAAGKAQRAGLVATNSIRGGASRRVLDRIVESATIFNAWSDEAWVNEGAAVRVSLICFANHSVIPAQAGIQLDGQPVAVIAADLTAGGVTLDLTKAQRLADNTGASFQGVVLIGPFEIDGNVARKWLTLPNPNGQPNSKVLRPLTNGKDIASRTRGFWVTDFGSMSETEAGLYEQPFEYVYRNVKPLRQNNPRINRRERWWIHGETGSGWRQVTSRLTRYLATSQVSKHRFFVWFPVVVWPHQTVIAIARDDDESFGVLNSRFHQLWALKLGTTLEDRPRYTPTTCFDTFPFPAGLTPNLPPNRGSNPRGDAIAATAQRLDELRSNWLNPPEWVERVPEVVPGYPDRIVAKPGHEAELKKRTLTNLYNQRPEWLANAHRTLDAAVAAAYGWTDYTPEMSDDEILKRLLALNLERSAR